jgi:hypothetical protein
VFAEHAEGAQAAQIGLPARQRTATLGAMVTGRADTSLLPSDQGTLATAAVWQAEGSQVPVPPTATLRVVPAGFVVEGPAWPGAALRTVIARLPASSVAAVDLRSPLGLRPALAVEAHDGTVLRVHGAPRELADIVDAWSALTGTADQSILRWPGQRLLSRLGTRRLTAAIATLLLAGVTAAAFASVPREAYDLLREDRQAVADLRVGDCFAEPDQPPGDEAHAVGRVRLLPCDGPHDAEVIALAAYPGAQRSYPGEPRVTEVAGRICLDALDAVASPRLRDALDVVFFYPTRATWSQGDRDIVCAAYRPDGTPLRRPVAGPAD